MKGPTICFRSFAFAGCWMGGWVIKPETVLNQPLLIMQIMNGKKWVRVLFLKAVAEMPILVLSLALIMSLTLSSVGFDRKMAPFGPQVEIEELEDPLFSHFLFSISELEGRLAVVAIFVRD